VVSIPACHAGDPGSIPGNCDFFVFLVSSLSWFLSPRIYEELYIHFPWAINQRPRALILTVYLSGQ
jgi:hypothetical protein